VTGFLLCPVSQVRLAWSPAGRQEASRFIRGTLQAMVQFGWTVSLVFDRFPGTDSSCHFSFQARALSAGTVHLTTFLYETTIAAWMLPGEILAFPA